ncbi:isoprenylcysteine carboxylmethyltransferase family protein [candidate division WOR-3 bacterium]|nr:isoprenylcysteine carboxylmethyltransferase family protein [candidate division WOR-3 bacterium]
MSLIPDFKIGLWNAWVLVVPLAILNVVVFPLVNLKAVRKARTWPKLKGALKVASYISIPICLIVFLYTIFVPLKLYTPWFWAGLPLYCLGLVIFTVSKLNYAAVGQDELATLGLYRISRHPIYIGIYLAFLGIGVMSASWVFLVFTVLYMILTHFSILAEERFCFDKYGEDYVRYMKTVRRYMGRFNKRT